MSKHAPTLSEFLCGYEIMVPQSDGAYLVAYSYISSVRRYQFRDLRYDTVILSKQMYSLPQAIDMYNSITPKKRQAV